MRLKLNSINALLTENHTTIKIIFQFLNLNKTWWKIILYVNYMYFHGINRSFFIFITRQHVCDAQHVNIKNVKAFMKPIARCRYCWHMKRIETKKQPIYCCIVIDDCRQLWRLWRRVKFSKRQNQQVFNFFPARFEDFCQSLLLIDCGCTA